MANSAARSINIHFRRKEYIARVLYSSDVFLNSGTCAVAFALGVTRASSIVWWAGQLGDLLECRVDLLVGKDRQYGLAQLGVSQSRVEHHRADSGKVQGSCVEIFERAQALLYASLPSTGKEIGEKRIEDIKHIIIGCRGMWWTNASNVPWRRSAGKRAIERGADLERKA
jgi:hypothetical protein